MNSTKLPHRINETASPTQLAPNSEALTWDDFMIGLSTDIPVTEARASLGRLLQE